MTHRPRMATRLPIKQNHILGDLRRQIVTGTYPPGSRLPLRSELQQIFGVSTATVQGALNRLIADGFVQAQGRLGTFVTRFPPHLCHYGLVFSRTPSASDARSRFYTALSSEAAALGQEPSRKIPVYFGVDGHTDSEVYQKLATDVQSHRLAGLILSFLEHHELDETPLMDEPDMPKVRITTGKQPGDVPAICLDVSTFIDKALDYLASRKRKRVALIIVPGTRQEHLDYFRNGVESRRMTTKAYWTQCVAWPEVQWARNAVQLLLHPDQKVCPDALIILDDNVVEHTTAGLVSIGVNVPDDVEVVAHSNFPWSPPGVLPLCYLGFDARHVLLQAIDNIDRQRRNELVPQVTIIPARFENETLNS